MKLVAAIHETGMRFVQVGLYPPVLRFLQPGLLDQVNQMQLVSLYSGRFPNAALLRARAILRLARWVKLTKPFPGATACVRARSPILAQPPRQSRRLYLGTVAAFEAVAEVALEAYGNAAFAVASSLGFCPIVKTVPVALGDAALNFGFARLPRFDPVRLLVAVPHAPCIHAPSLGAIDPALVVCLGRSPKAAMWFLQQVRRQILPHDNPHNSEQPPS